MSSPSCRFLYTAVQIHVESLFPILSEPRSRRLWEGEDGATAQQPIPWIGPACEQRRTDPQKASCVRVGRRPNQLDVSLHVTIQRQLDRTCEPQHTVVIHSDRLHVRACNWRSGRDAHSVEEPAEEIDKQYPPSLSPFYFLFVVQLWQLLATCTKSGVIPLGAGLLLA